VAHIVRTWGEIKLIRLLPLRKTASSRSVEVEYIWPGNAMECVKFLHEKDVRADLQIPESSFQQSVFLNATLLQNKKRTVFKDKELKKLLLSEAKAAVANEPDLVDFVAHSISPENPPAFTGNTVYALHDILKQIESLNPSDLVHDFELPDLPSPEYRERHSASSLSLASLPADLQQLLTPSNSHQTSIHENELDDRTQYAFGQGKTTTKISTRDLLNQQKNL